MLLFCERPNPKCTKLDWCLCLPSRAAVLSAQHGLTHVGVVNVVAVCGRRGRILARMVRWFVSTDSCIWHGRREQGGERREEGEQLGGREEEEGDQTSRSKRIR